MANKNLKKLLLELDPDEESQVLIDSMEEISDEITDVKAKLDALDVGAVVEEAVTPIIEDIQQLKKDVKAKGAKGEKGDSGKDGRNGKDGKDGKDGKQGSKGEQGEPGKDGKGVSIGDVLSRLPDLGRGGSINRQIFVGGVDALKRYSDINLKAGANVTLTFANNDATQKVDVTIAATGGSGSGITRSINSVAVNTVAGDTASVDYVYLVSGTTTITLPTAVGNTNLYTVKNVGTGVVTVNTTLSETIDGSLTITMPVQYTSIDIESDSANWNIT